MLDRIDLVSNRYAMPKLLDISEGMKFGSRTVIRELDARRVKQGTVRMFEVQCDCGAISIIRLGRLRANLKSCQHCPSKSGSIQVGDTFGNFQAVSTSYKREGARYYVADVKCGCGKVETRAALKLQNNTISQCVACANLQRHINEGGYPELRPFTKHPYYGIWAGIKDRILNQCSHAYQYYGGKGLTMHDEWIHSFGAFATWIEEHLGTRPGPEYSIDRINTKYGYHPFDPEGNLQLQWALQDQQNKNRNPFKKNWGLWKVGEHIGTLFNVCKRFGVNDSTVKQYTRTSHTRETMTLAQAIQHVIKKHKGIDVDVTCIEAPAG